MTLEQKIILSTVLLALLVMNHAGAQTEKELLLNELYGMEKDYQLLLKTGCSNSEAYEKILSTINQAQGANSSVIETKMRLISLKLEMPEVTITNETSMSVWEGKENSVVINEILKAENMNDKIIDVRDGIKCEKKVYELRINNSEFSIIEINISSQARNPNIIIAERSNKEVISTNGKRETGMIYWRGLSKGINTLYYVLKDVQEEHPPVIVESASIKIREENVLLKALISGVGIFLLFITAGIMMIKVWVKKMGE